jgi:hypothetical protein
MLANASKLTQSRAHDAPANRRALNHLFSEYERARAERDAAEARLGRFSEVIALLIDSLPPADKAEYRRRFEELRQGSPPQRGGEVYGNVIALFKKDIRPEWTIPDAQAALAQNGVSVDPKALYNAFTYLANTGRLQRVSRGHYIVTGLNVSIEYPEEIAGAPPRLHRVTEHDV